MGLSIKRLELEDFHSNYGKLAMIPFPIGTAFGLIDSFVYANQGTAYPELKSVGIKNEPGKAWVSSLSSLPIPGVPAGKGIKAGEEVLEDVLKYGDDAYEIAKNGGKHSGTYEQALKMTDKQLEKSIKSLEKQIEIHKDKIMNPSKYYPDFNKLSQREQIANLTKGWPKEIKALSDKIQILQKILQGKK